MDDYKLRLRIFSVVVTVMLALLGGRLVKLQILDQEHYQSESLKVGVKERIIEPVRGVIYDRNGVILADNVPTYDVTVTPKYFDEATIPLLARLLAVPDTAVARKYDEARNWSLFRPSKIFKDVQFDVVSRVYENANQLPGIEVVKSQKRRYPTVRMAHGLGYVKEVNERQLGELREQGYRLGDRVGQAGLEASYESVLRGRPGRENRMVTRAGADVGSFQNGMNDVPPESGYELHLSIDAGVQALAETLFVNKRGGAVAMDPKTGEIIAFVSAPDYNPELLSGSLTPETWAWLNGPTKPLLSRAAKGAQPPGSTFKPFMALMALEEGIITENSRINCPGGYYLGGRLFKCHGGAHGPISVRTAIQKSCNTFFFTLMMRTDVDTWANWSRRFGFGTYPPIDLETQELSPGIVGDSAYYNRQWPRGWTSGFSINTGIGQGAITTTPLQLARYTAAVANGGMLPPPHLVREIVNPDEVGARLKPDVPQAEKLPISPEHFVTVREGMKLVMEAGTGRGVQIDGISAGGKTGTAQAAHSSHDDHSVFIMFAPWDDPQIAIGVIVENGGFGATQAAPIATLMAEKYLTGTVDLQNPRRRYLYDRLLRLTSPMYDNL